MTTFPARVTIVEVGPRDGLQNEAVPIATATKLAFIQKLVDAGLKDIEVASFVHPKAVPQLADAAEVIRGLPSAPGVTFSALVPNEKGLERAIEAGVRRIAVFTAASETFTRKNINMTIDESLRTFQPVGRSALAKGISVRGYVSTCFVCPYEGEVSKNKVREVSERLLEIGVDQVAISDTIGAAAPTDVHQTVGFVLERVPRERIALHFHDTYGTALANVFAGLELGITTYDSSAGGLGGCPFAPGASGNLATEDLVYMLDRMGIESGVSLDGVLNAARTVATALGRDLPSRQWKRTRPLSLPVRGQSEGGIVYVPLLMSSGERLYVPLLLTSGWNFVASAMSNHPPTTLTPKHISFDTVDSTNEAAKRLIADGSIVQPTYITAREQTAGKGSRGRAWLSPRDAGIYLSVIDLPPADVPPEITIFTLAAGVACVETLAQAPGITIRLKPVNDLYIQGRKLGGILTEAVYERGSLRAVITGIGINIRDVPRSIGGSEPISVQTVLSAYDFAHLDLGALSAALTNAVLRENQAVWRGETAYVQERWNRHRLEVDRA